MIELIASSTLAADSPDHTSPWGTMRDNSTHAGFIADVERCFGVAQNSPRTLDVLDLGCAGGQLAVDFHLRGHHAVGLEGSDYSSKHGRANWPVYEGSVLFTCDICQPFYLKRDGQRMAFDCITAWEVLEHPRPDEVRSLLATVSTLLAPAGIFCASICLIPDCPQGVQLHQTVMTKKEWEDLLYTWFQPVTPCPIRNWVRGQADENSLLVCLEKKVS